ncbi:Hypothetical predicted protein [Mytilus galloprovincialis]|uniref:Uncharacterized protein n=1 Tax=Mytilus galloprovincialis TaxID=29158 RepID=A0A8B6EK17_MYTGA|nr:Hypothetical predicted protein [Mytilus galloprovincialis]
METTAKIANYKSNFACNIKHLRTIHRFKSVPAFLTCLTTMNEDNITQMFTNKTISTNDAANELNRKKNVGQII